MAQEGAEAGPPRRRLVDVNGTLIAPPATAAAALSSEAGAAAAKLRNGASGRAEFTPRYLAARHALSLQLGQLGAALPIVSLSPLVPGRAEARPQLAVFVSRLPPRRLFAQSRRRARPTYWP